MLQLFQLNLCRNFHKCAAVAMSVLDLIKTQNSSPAITAGEPVLPRNDSARRGDYFNQIYLIVDEMLSYKMISFCDWRKTFLLSSKDMLI